MGSSLPSPAAYGWELLAEEGLSTTATGAQQRLD